MYLIVGATGRLGSELCTLLSSTKKPFRALVRHSSKPDVVESIKKIGGEIMFGDLKNEASLIQACTGISTVISTASSLLSHHLGDSISSVDLEGHKSLIRSALQTGVKKFIYISLSQHHKTDCALTAAKRAVEKYLIKSKLNYTIIRPAAYMEFWLNPSCGFDFNRNKATIFGSGKSKISFISIKDVARFVTLTLENPNASNTILEIGGPNAVSYLDAVNYFEKVTGKIFRVRKIGEDTLIFQKKFSSNPFSDSIVSHRMDLLAGDEIDMRKTMSQYPINLTSFQDYATTILNKKTA